MSFKSLEKLTRLQIFAVGGCGDEGVLLVGGNVHTAAELGVELQKREELKKKMGSSSTFSNIFFFLMEVFNQIGT